MSKIEEAKQLLDRYQEDVERLVREARLEGFEEGLASNVKPPTDAEFRKHHKTVQMYGEDYAAVVYARSAKAAAKLLEVDEEFVEEIGISWSAYEIDGQIVVGYYLGKGEPLWTAYGVYS